MKKFILRDLQSGVDEEYEGYVENSTYHFISTKDSSSCLTIKDEGKGKALFLRKTKSVEIKSFLEVNKVSSLSLKMLDIDRVGEFPILVRNVDVNYPKEILFRYHLLDEKNVPIETCEILVVEKL